MTKTTPFSHSKKQANLNRVLPIIAILLLWTGCSEAPKKVATNQEPTSTAWVSRKTKLQRLDQWEISGRLSIVSQPQDQPAENIQASFHWQQQPAYSTLYMVGPVGQGAVRIEEHAGSGVILTDQKGERHEAYDASELLQMYTGWQIPVEGLRYWIRGIPIPNLPAEDQRFNQEGQLENLTQDGWEIRFLDYRLEPPTGTMLPYKLFCSYPELSVKLKLLVDKSSFPPLAN